LANNVNVLINVLRSLPSFRRSRRSFILIFNRRRRCSI